jgi:hypothetical protein
LFSWVPCGTRVPLFFCLLIRAAAEALAAFLRSIVFSSPASAEQCALRVPRSFICSRWVSHRRLFVLHFLVKQRPCFRFSTHRHANRDTIPSRSTRQRSPEGTRHNTPRISRRASVAVILLGSCVWKNFLPTSLTDITPSKCSLSLSLGFSRRCSSDLCDARISGLPGGPCPGSI